MASSFLQGCCCCAACRPRYRRLVDSIYPAAPPTQGLVKSNMEKLTYYAISRPEKLDRIGEYLLYRLSKDVYRQRASYVRVSVEAMDQLLAACHGSPSLNLFVESFLKTVQKLLETQDPALEILATDSFVAFANIEEDAPSYHRRYDFFISKFSSLCHNSNANLTVRKRLRIAGLRGLHGVVRKTISDDLQANIWEKQHMDKIVPSLLFNLHDDYSSVGGDDAEDKADGASESCPELLAADCLSELMMKASFGSMSNVLGPVLKHCDNHWLWTGKDNAGVLTSIFKTIICSLQNQYQYAVVQMLIHHLDQHANARAEIRLGISRIISEIVLVAAGASMGPSLLEIFNSLLRHLRSSVEHQLNETCPSVEMEKKNQETLINTMGDFANSLPDYQKVEIMMFIIGKVPMPREEQMKKSEMFLQNVLVKTLLKVATKYKTGYLATALTTSFLGPLLKLALVDDPKVRLLIMQILHTLLDRHDNLSRLQRLGWVKDVSELRLTVEKCSRADQMFMRKNSQTLLLMLYRSALLPSNVSVNYDALLCTLCLLCVEIGYDELLMDLFRLSFVLQSVAVENKATTASALSTANRRAVIGLVARYLNLTSQLLAIPALCQHVQQVLEQQKDVGLWSEEDVVDSAAASSAGVEEEIGPIDDLTLAEQCVMFDKAAVAESLKASGKDVSRLVAAQPPFEFSAAASVHNQQQPNITDGAASAVSADDNSLDSVSSAGGSLRGGCSSSRRNTFNRELDAAPLTIDKIREIVSRPPEAFEKEEEERTRRVLEFYRSKPLDELMEFNRRREVDLAQTVRTALQRLDEKKALESNGRPPYKPKTIFDIEFPEGFVC